MYKQYDYCNLHIANYKGEIRVMSYAAWIMTIDTNNKVIFYDDYYLDYSPTTIRHFTKAIKKVLGFDISIKQIRIFFKNFRSDGVVDEYNGYKFQPM